MSRTELDRFLRWVGDGNLERFPVTLPQLYDAVAAFRAAEAQSQ